MLVMLASGTAIGADPQPTIQVYKTPTCGCCTKWIDSLRAAHFEAGDRMLRAADAAPTPPERLEAVLLEALPLENYPLHWAPASRGELFREHNSVVVTARGGALETGIVLDPWRESGELYWSLVSEDRYPWEPY